MDARNIILRPVSMDDCRLIWEWANDPEVRAASFSEDLIPWATHVKWFEDKQNDPNCYFYMAIDERGTPVGQIRFDCDEKGEAEVHVSVGQNNRGLGLGSIIIGKAVNELFSRTSILCVHAFVQLHNYKSMRAFEKAGFKCVGVGTVKGVMAKHYLVERGNVPLVSQSVV